MNCVAHWKVVSPWREVKRCGGLCRAGWRGGCVVRDEVSPWKVCRGLNCLQLYFKRTGQPLEVLERRSVMIRLKYYKHPSDCYAEMDCGRTGGTQRICGESSEEVPIVISAGGEGEFGKKGAGRLALGTLPFLGSPLVLSAMLAALPQAPWRVFPWTLWVGAPQGSSDKLFLARCHLHVGDTDSPACISLLSIRPANPTVYSSVFWMRCSLRHSPKSPHISSPRLGGCYPGTHPGVQRRNLGQFTVL